MSVALPASGNENSLVTVDKKISPGKLTKLEILFPAGHDGLTFFAIRFNDRQIYPNLLGTFMQGGDTLLNFNPGDELIEAPYKLTLAGYNIDDTYNHTVYVWFELAEISKSLSLLRFLK